MATTYDFISQNKRRTWLLVLLFPVTFALLGYVFLLGFSYLSVQEADISSHEAFYETSGAYYSGEGTPAERANRLAAKILPWMWLAAVAWIIISYYAGDAMLLRGAGAVEITQDDQPEIYRLVENLCITAGLPVPRVYIINDSSLNAFATGRDPQHASVALTKGIVQKLERAELEGVIAHELSHVKNRDIRLMLITVAGISFCTFAAEICFRIGSSASRRSGKNKGGAAALFLAAGVFFAVYGYLIAPLIRLAVSRTREYYADASAALITRNPGALASALEKITADPVVEKLESHASMAAMCIANPLSKMGLFAELSGMFSTHPPVEKRIAALREMDGR